MSTVWSIQDINGVVIWTSTDTCLSPSPVDLSFILKSHCSDNDIHHITSQILRNAPAKSIALLLTCISCNSWRTNDNTIDPMRIHSLKNANPKIVCGKVFRRGELVWSCRSCQKDSTCVQCDDCFRNSNHEGHEVYFHRESEKEGGCCDCGDLSAWSKAGNCTNHNHEINDSIDPVSILPNELLKSLKPVLVAIAGIISSYVTCIARGYQKVDYNDFLNYFIEKNQENKLVIRLHNDDIHTYDEVTDALKNAGEDQQRAEQLTKLVDKAGEASVHTIEGKRSLNEKKWKTYYQALSVEAGLLFSIVPENIYVMGPKITAAIQWLQSLGTMNDGIRRLISHSIIIHVNELPDCTNAYPSIAQFQPNMIFSKDAKNKFPNVIQHLASPSDDDFVKLDENPFDLALHPFNTCHKNCLSLMIAASPYLGKSVKKAINDIVLVYQHDMIFKSVYSQSLTTLYPMLYFLFNKSVGTLENSIFNTTVQIYTCKTVVRTMSSDGINERILRDSPVEEGGSNVHISKILSSTLRYSFNAIDFLTLEVPSNDPYHLRFRNYCHALHQVCRDFEYVWEDPLDAVRGLSDRRDPGVVDDLLTVFSKLESVHMHKRVGEREGHVERESDKWQEYWKVMGELESVTTKIATSAFFTKIPNHNVSEALILQAEKEYDNCLIDALQNVTNKTLQKLDEWTKAFESTLSDHFFKIADEPIICLGHPIIFRAYRRYQVSVSPVSINLPLHHFLSKIMTFSCYGGIDLEITLKTFSNYPDAVWSLADYPLRCLSFSAQVNSGMWRRNGNSLFHMAYLYQTFPYVRYNMDIDIHAVQIAIAVAGPDSIIALAIDRFEVFSLLETKDYNNAADPINGSKGNLLAQLLRTLIHVSTQTPFVLDIIRKETNNIDPVDIEGIKMAVRSEVAHCLLSGSKNISSMSKIRALIGGDKTVSDDLIKSAIDELCNKRDMGDDRVSLEPKDIVYECFDPEFPHLSQKQSLVAIEAVREHRKKASESKRLSGKEDFDISPIVTLASIRKPHPQFLCVRTFLYRPFTISILDRCMRLTLDSIGPSRDKSAPRNGGNTCEIVSKIVHIITLQIHCFPDFKREFCKGVASYKSAKYFNRGQNFAEELPDHNNIEKNAEIEKKFTLTLADVYLQGVLRTDELYESGLKWVLKELSTHNEIVRNLLSSKDINFKISIDDTLERRKNSAKERLNAKMKAQIASFNLLMTEMEEDDDDDDVMNTDTHEHETPMCIVCMQNTSERIGYLSYLQASSVLKQTISLSDDNQSQVMNSIYRVVALKGCDIMKSNDNTATIKHHLQQGEHILVSSQVGRWFKVVAPVSGWCALYSIPNSGDDSSDGSVAQLYPVKELQYNRFGSNRVHVSSCNHCMHRSCWETYHATSLSNTWNTNQGGRFAIDVEKGELQCPLCKGITNSFLPRTSSDVARSSIEVIPTQKDLLSHKLSISYDWSNISSLISAPVNHTPRLSSVDKYFVESCLNQLVPAWDDDNTEHENIKTLENKRNLHTARCIQSGWTTAAYTLLSSCCNGRWIHSNPVEFLKNDSTELTMITQLILCLRNSPNWFGSMNEYNDFVLNPLQRLISGSISSILVENFGSDESMSDIVTTKGFRLLDSNSCSLKDCYLALLQLPSYTVPHPSLLPNSKRLSLILDLFHMKGVPEKYLWNYLHIPLLSHDLHVIAIAVTSCIQSLESLDECLGILCIARLVQILIEPTSLGFISINKSLKRERSDLPKCTSWATESRLLSDLRSHVCSICKIPISDTLNHEDELTEHTLNLWLHYLEYACMLSYVVHRAVEPSLNDTYFTALSQSGTQLVRVNRILTLFGIPHFSELLTSVGVLDLSTMWCRQFFSVSPESLDTEQIQRTHHIVPSTMESKTLEGSNTGSLNVMDLELSSPTTSRRVDMNFGNTINVMDLNDDNQLLEDDGDNGTYGEDNSNNEDGDEDNEDLDAMDDGIVDDNMQAIFETFLGALLPPNADANIISENATKWKLVGVYPSNKFVDEHLPDMFYLPLTGETLASFHSSTPLLGSISGTHVINGLNGERLEHVFSDMSHMSLSVKHKGGLIKLPSLYTDLYKLAKAPEGPSGIIIDDPAVCLVCGRICSGGNRKNQPPRMLMNANIDPGEATLHARECGAGTGVFFLAHKCSVLLIRGSRSMFYPSVYVDSNGETGEGLHSNKPLFLSPKKYRKLEELYLKHQIGTEITRHRSTADRYIRGNWY